MPEVSRFLGIVIAMFYNEHVPPHFHAVYGEYKVTIEIEGGVTSGRFPRRALNLVTEWQQEHRRELMENWERARARLPLRKIEPLE
ncbi:MAG TPA: DUF4160 domain-containing protein [Terriglobia bacterium]|nr:DUF4160 domain-containing protein [Terriglobia bacterium]